MFCKYNRTSSDRSGSGLYLHNNSMDVSFALKEVVQRHNSWLSAVGNPFMYGSHSM